jgi:hypothetical protein
MHFSKKKTECNEVALCDLKAPLNSKQTQRPPPI